MGCDINLYIEYKDKDNRDRWNGFGGRINPGRNYRIFSKLVGVINYDGYGIVPLSEPKGIPERISWESENDFTMFVSEISEGEGYCTKEKADRWISSGSSVKWDSNRITHPDWHSASWSTADELEEAFKDPKTQFGEEPEYQAVLDCLRSFERQGYEARIVFWFDN